MIAFDEYKNLRRVEIQQNSELKVIEEAAFNYTMIESFAIPPYLKVLDGLKHYPYFKIIEFDDNYELKSINASLFDNCRVADAIVMISQNISIMNPSFDKNSTTEPSFSLNTPPQPPPEHWD